MVEGSGASRHACKPTYMACIYIHIPIFFFLPYIPHTHTYTHTHMPPTHRGEKCGMIASLFFPGDTHDPSLLSTYVRRFFRASKIASVIQGQNTYGIFVTPWQQLIEPPFPGLQEKKPYVMEREGRAVNVSGGSGKKWRKRRGIRSSYLSLGSSKYNYPIGDVDGTHTDTDTDTHTTGFILSVYFNARSTVLLDETTLVPAACIAPCQAWEQRKKI